MVTLWYAKIKLGLNELIDVPGRYYQQVLDLLVAEGLYDEDGNKL